MHEEVCTPHLLACPVESTSSKSTSQPSHLQLLICTSGHLKMNFLNDHCADDFLGGRVFSSMPCLTLGFQKSVLHFSGVPMQSFSALPYLYVFFMQSCSLPSIAFWVSTITPCVPRHQQTQLQITNMRLLPSLAWRPGSGTARRPTPRPLGSSARRHQCGGQQMAFIDK